MKSLHKLITALLFIFFCLPLFAQPYTLDENVKPVQLDLKEDKKREGATAVAANVTITNEIQYFFVKGCNMLQFIDVFIFSNFGNPDFKADLVRNTWEDIEQSASTGSSDKGIINFKLRAEGDFGFKVIPTGEKINYTIVVYASPPAEDYLGSAFRKANDSEIKVGGESSSDSGGGSSGNGSGGPSNTLLYVIIGVALLVIGFLASKVLSKKSTNILLLLFTFTLCSTGLAQDDYGLVPELETVDIEDIRNDEYRRTLNEMGSELFEGAGGAVDAALDRLDEVGDIIRDDDRYRVVRDLYDSYTGLGDCINSTPPPGMPRIPSFCDTDECGTCFTNARRKFNQNRYTFERLKTIYSCTKTFTDRAIAFGDNVSGVHGVSGLAWQSEKRKIEKSVKDLQKAYDDKYVELLQSQREALMMLNECEGEHGIPDWYDRFGYMYYEFTAMNYRRAN